MRLYRSKRKPRGEQTCELQHADQIRLFIPDSIAEKMQEHLFQHGAQHPQREIHRLLCIYKVNCSDESENCRADTPFDWAKFLAFS